MKITTNKNGKLKPGLLLIISGVLLFLLSYFLGDRTADIHFYDTYYVLPMRPAFFVHALLLIVTGGLMSLFANERFFRILSIVLAVLTFLTTCGACYALWRSYLLFSARPERYIDFADDFIQINQLYLACIAIIISVQIGFILIGLYRLITGKGNLNIEKSPIH
jgi:heme/copper-type cytochrome/quinol oxidase subunit 1